MLKTENQCKYVRDTITHYLETIETEISVNEINDYISQSSETTSKTTSKTIYTYIAQVAR